MCVNVLILKIFKIFAKIAVFEARVGIKVSKNELKEPDLHFYENVMGFFSVGKSFYFVPV